MGAGPLALGWDGPPNPARGRRNKDGTWMVSQGQSRDGGTKGQRVLSDKHQAQRMQGRFCSWEGPQEVGGGQQTGAEGSPPPRFCGNWRRCPLLSADTDQGKDPVPSPAGCPCTPELAAEAGPSAKSPAEKRRQESPREVVLGPGKRSAPRRVGMTVHPA